MAVYMPNSLFVHIPKTGGMWVTETIKKCGVRYLEPDYTHSIPDLEMIGDRWIFVAIRHPATWLVSFFKHRERNNWNWDHEHAREIDKLCCAYDLESFIENIIANPGVLRRHIGRFVDPYREYSKLVVGKTESLRDDFGKFLRIAGEQHNPDVIRDTPRIHVGQNAVLAPNLLAELYRSEQELYRMFDYDMFP